MKTISRVDGLHHKGRPRKKAFIGAIIGAVTAIGGGIVKGIAANKERKRQARAEAEQKAREDAMNLTKAYANNDAAQDELEDRFKPEFKAGGTIHIAPSKRGTFTAAATKHGMGVQSFASKVLSNKENYSPAMVKKANFARNASKWKHRLGGVDKLRCGGRKKYAVGGVKPVITEGGQAERIDDRTFLLRGRKHETGGIVIGQGRRSIEAEDGEVLRLGKGNIKILSDQPILNGESPAKKAVRNPDAAESAFKAQEEYKDRNNLNDDGTKKYKQGGKVDGKQFDPNNDFNLRSMSAVNTRNGKKGELKTKDGIRVEYSRKKLTDIKSGNPINGLFQHNKKRNKNYDDTNYRRYSKPVGDNERAFVNTATSLLNPIGIPLPPLVGLGKTVYDEAVRGSLQDIITDGKQDERVEANVKLFKYGGDRPMAKLGISRSVSGNSLRKPSSTLSSVGRIKRKKADFGAIMSGVATGMNIASPVISGITGLVQANKLKKPESPTLYGATKLKTTFNINPQLASLERSRQRGLSNVDRDTASSAAAIARKQSIDTSTTEQGNILMGQKENIETELINKDRLNAQNQADKNVATINQYKDQLTNFHNTKIGIRNEAINAIVGGVQSGLNDMQIRMDAKKAQQQEEAILIGGDVNNSIPRLIASGYEFDRKTLESYYNMPGLNPEVKQLIADKLGIRAVKRGRLSSPSTLPKP